VSLAKSDKLRSTK